MLHSKTLRLVKLDEVGSAQDRTESVEEDSESNLTTKSRPSPWFNGLLPRHVELFMKLTSFINYSENIKISKQESKY